MQQLIILPTHSLLFYVCTSRRQLPSRLAKAVMDPLTISTAVLACAKIALSVSISLGDFIRDAKNVDENTRSLEQEIVHLSHDCRLVAQELTRLPAGVCAGGGDPLFTRIKSRISACTESLQKLNLAIKSLRPNRSNIVAKGVSIEDHR